MRTALALKEPDNCEMEYEERDRKVFIDGAVEDHTLNHDIFLETFDHNNQRAKDLEKDLLCP